MKKSFFVTMLIVMIAFSFVSCGRSQDKVSLGERAEAEKDTVKVGVVFTMAGLGDNNFNDMVYTGLKNAEKDFGIRFDYAEPASDGELMTLLFDFAQSGSYDLIITLSSESTSAMEEVSEKYPGQKFTIIDTVVDNPNVHSLAKASEQQVFLNGVLAGLMTQDTSYPFVNDRKVVGCVLGADFPNLRGMLAGYMTGAKFFDPEVEVLYSFVGDFSDVNKGKEMAISQYNSGADIIQNLQGSGAGIINAAEEKKFYVLGSGTNQNGLSPDRFVSTAGFSLTQLVYDEVRDLVDGTWQPGITNPGIKDGAFMNIYDLSNIVVSDEILAKVDEAYQWYMDNDVKLPNEPSMVDQWIKENR